MHLLDFQYHHSDGTGSSVCDVCLHCSAYAEAAARFYLVGSVARLWVGSNVVLTVCLSALLQPIIGLTSRTHIICHSGC